MIQHPDVLRVGEVAKMLNSRPEFIRILLRSGKLKGFRMGKEWRITRQSIDEFIAGGGTANEVV